LRCCFPVHLPGCHDFVVGIGVVHDGVGSVGMQVFAAVGIGMEDVDMAAGVAENWGWRSDRNRQRVGSRDGGSRGKQGRRRREEEEEEEECAEKEAATAGGGQDEHVLYTSK